MDNDANYRHAAELIAQADALVIGAGAGIGVDSGLPDFRGNQGFWNAYPPLGRARVEFAAIASPRTFEVDPGLAWGFYGHRLSLYRQTVPHDGFAVLHKWAQRAPLGAWIYTSNVDGQFQKAGFADDQIHECHGSIHHLQCMRECRSGIWSADSFHPEVDTDSCRLIHAPPTCPHCGGLARPNIVMFGDWDWLSTRSEHQRRREAQWLDTVTDSRANVVVIEIGAGTAIPSVRHFSHLVSRRLEARIIRINPRESQVPSSHDIGISAGSLEALRSIDVVLDALYDHNDAESD